MEVDFVDENAWKNKDIALAYQYTTGSSPAIEKDKATFNWTNELLELRYSDQTDASTQQWQFFKVKEKIDYVTNTEDTVPSQIIPVGTKATKPSVTKKGYVFEGWYTTEDFQTGTVTVNKGTPITSDKIAALLVPVEKWVTSDGQDWNIETDNVTANMEIHPVWKLNDPEVNLSAEGNVTKVHTGNSVKLIAEA